MNDEVWFVDRIRAIHDLLETQLGLISKLNKRLRAVEDYLVTAHPLITDEGNKGPDVCPHHI